MVLQVPQEHVTDPQEVAPKPEVRAIGAPASVPKIVQVLQEAFGTDPAVAAVPERDEEVLIYGPSPADHVNICPGSLCNGRSSGSCPEVVREHVEVNDRADAPEMVPEIRQVDLGSLHWVRRRRTRVRYLEARKYIYRPLPPHPPPPPPPRVC